MTQFNVLKVPGFELSYTIEGRGIPTLVIGDCTYYPRTFSHNLRKFLQIIFMEHRGFGKATAPATDQSYELEKILLDIENLRIKLQLPKVVLVGHSIHALIAIEFAKKYPDSVEALVLIASSPIVGRELHEAANKNFLEEACPERKEALAKSLSSLEAEVAANPERAFITRMLNFAPMIWYDWTYDAENYGRESL